MSLNVQTADVQSLAMLLLRGQDLLLVVGLLLLIFGGKKLPELAKGLGESIRNFKTSIKEDEVKAEEKKEAYNKSEV